MASIFTKIVSGEIPCHKIAENEDFLAFLDIMPLKRGHVLVIPKKEVDYIFDMDDELYVGLQLFAKKVAQGMKKVLPCKRVGVAVIGLEVPHTHIHLVPLEVVGDINFTAPKLTVDNEEMTKIAKEISEAI